MKILLALTFLFCLIACGSKNEPYAAQQNMVSTDKTVCYSKDIQPIMDNYCVRCHSKYATYSRVEPDMYRIEFQTSSGSMPRDASMTDSEILKIKNWVANGGIDCK